MKERITKFTIALLSVIMVCLLAVPASADYDFDGFEVNEMTNGTVQGDVFVSYGDNGGLANTPYSTDYSVPGGTVKWARLIVGVWGGTENYVGWVNTTFNNHCEGNVTMNKSVDTSTYSTGTNVYGTGHGVWMVSYNCTDNMTMGATNTAVANTGSISGSFDGRVYGIALVVVYENSSLPKVQYWINEGNMNLHYETGGNAAVNKTFAWFNGTAYNSTEANLTVVQYTGSDGEPDYLFFNAPDASDSPYSDNIYYNITKYNYTQMNSNDVADSHSDQEGVCDDNSVFTYGFDFNCFSYANDLTSLYDIVNITDNNYAIFWRGRDNNNDGTITASFQPEDPVEGESYVHPILAVLRLKDITHVYDFSDNTPGTAGTDAWAYRYQVDGSPTASDPSTEFTTYANIAADDALEVCDVTTTDGSYAAHRFNFSIDETDPEMINVTWIGRGWHDSDSATDGAKLYIYNFSTPGYELLQTSSNVETEVTLTGEKASSISSYINSGNVTILVNQTSAQTKVGKVTKYSHIATDYVKLVVTP